MIKHWVKRLTLAAWLAATVGGAAAAQTSQDGGTALDTRDEACATSTWRRVGQGQVRLRDCAVQRLEALRASSSADHDTVAEAGRQLAEYYRSRGGRQQAFIDTGAGVSGLGALGYAVSGPAGTATQNLWGYGALAPVLLVQFNANEPTRDLYFAGDIAAGLLNERYGAVNQRLGMLDGYPDRDVGATCLEADRRLGQMATWPDTPARADLRPQMLELVTRCRDFNLARGRVTAMSAAATHWKTQWARAYASDLLQLHARLTERDQRLRTTPDEALKLMISTPLRQLDTLVSGESVQAAVDTIKVMTALDGLGFRLASFDLPAPPSPIEAAFALPGPAHARMVDPPARYPTCPPRPAACTYDPGETARWLHARLAELEAAREAQNLRAGWATGMGQAVQAVDLTFGYNVGANRIDVMLRAPEPGATSVTTQPGR